ncbi:hypothetical protein [Streptomyces angustmyceticus]|uniref:hypothetical protein n=1 Tax=Streptomyces angustmyceticus TaxID=285578 RepID=UPI00344F52D7
MAIYRVYGTTVASPKPDDWQLIQETTDPVEATNTAHKTEGTFWRRLTEDDAPVLDRI